VNFYIHDLATSFRIELEGDLSGKAVLELEQSWRTAGSVIGDRALVIAVGNVSNIDLAGRALLQSLHRAGARFVAKSPPAEALVTTITETE
jgi:ABC-type transporter Mla MlaB component